MAKKKEKPGVMMYWPVFEVLKTLESSQCQTMVNSICEYSRDNKEPNFGSDATLKALWIMIKPQIDADTERYETIRVKRAAAANARWEKESEKT